MRKPKRIHIKPHGEKRPAPPERKRSSFNSTDKQTLILWGLLGLCLVSFITVAAVLWLDLDKADQAPKPLIGNDSAKSDEPLAPYDTTYLVLNQELEVTAYLKAVGFPNSFAEELAYQADSAGLHKFRAAGEIRLLNKKRSPADKRLIYREDAYKTWVFKTSPRPSVQLRQKKGVVVTTAKGGIIRDGFLATAWQRGIPHDLIVKIEKALQWSVDLYHAKQGDEFRVVYEENVVDGRVVSTGRLLAVTYVSPPKRLVAYRVDTPAGSSFFDRSEKNLESRFLMSPLRYGRISSRYNPERKHPVLQIVRGHFGTDYAAPIGTPIRAVGDGTVEIASQTKNNGNYVKIRHDETYKTQYLHLSRFAEGIKKGTTVKQGQTIGFVGQTGLASGPHVCFRFWRYGKQVDHLKEPIVSKQVALPAASRVPFRQARDSLDHYLNQVNVFSESI